MIPVSVGENKIDIVVVCLAKLVAEPSNTGARIHRNNIIVLGTDFQTGGIAAVFQICFARNRN